MRDATECQPLPSTDGSSSVVPVRHSFALVPPEPLAQVFARHRARFDPGHADTVPHITMKLGFVLGDGALATHSDLVEWLEQECRQQRPFEVQLGEVGMFSSCSGYGHVVYVGVCLTPALMELHSRLVEGLAKVGARTSGVSVEREVVMFFPHLTLAQGLTEAGAQEALAAAQRELTPVMFLADRLVTARSADGERWAVDGQVRFCGETVVALSTAGESVESPSMVRGNRRGMKGRDA